MLRYKLRTLLILLAVLPPLLWFGLGEVPGVEGRAGASATNHDRPAEVGRHRAMGRSCWLSAHAGGAISCGSRMRGMEPTTEATPLQTLLALIAGEEFDEDDSWINITAARWSGRDSAIDLSVRLSDEQLQNWSLECVDVRESRVVNSGA